VSFDADADPVAIPAGALSRLRHGWAAPIALARAARPPAVVAVLPQEAAGALSRPLAVTAFGLARRHLSVVHNAGAALARAVREALARGDPAGAEALAVRAGPELPSEAPRVVGRALCDYNELKLPLVVRPASPGERMQPLGARGRRPLRRLYRQAVGAGAAREALPSGWWPPLVVSGDEPLWFVGVRLADRFRVRPGTGDIAVLEALAADKGGP
ncbi:MAG: tRNA lysidine(34) synthetase TilS, partial [Symbiobacteriaceae bacterium]